MFSTSCVHNLGNRRCVHSYIRGCGFVGISRSTVISRGLGRPQQIDHRRFLQSPGAYVKNNKDHQPVESSQLVAISELVREAVVVRTLDGIVSGWNAAAERMLGYTSQEIIGKPFSILVPTESLQQETQILERARHGERTEDFETRRADKNGQLIEVSATFAPLRDELGRVSALLSVITDLSERKRLEIAERDQLFLGSLISSADDAIVSKDLNGVVTSWNNGAERLFGYSADEVIGKSISILIPPDHQDEERAILGRIGLGLPANHFETIRHRKDGTPVDISLTVSPLYDAANAVVGASIIARDITARKRAEEHQRLLKAELDHRVKNVLATVSAIVDQTQETSDTQAGFVSALSHRIKCLASTHELLSQGQWRGVSLAEIVRRELAPYATNKTTSEGPSVTLKAEATQAVAMVLHELTTNAAKYGGLSARGGGVLLRWRWLRNGSGARLTIEWQEVGGPQVAPPSRSGYGTSIVREVIPCERGGSVDLEFAADGVRCRLEIPAEWVSNETPQRSPQQINASDN